MKNKVLVAIIVLLIIALGVVGGLYLNEINYKISKSNNYLENLYEKSSGIFGMHLNLNYASEKIIINEIENTTDLEFYGYRVTYHYTGENMGKLLLLKETEDAYGGIELNINGDIIQDMRVGTNFNGLFAETFEVGETYNFTSTLYILFNNGTIGKITTDDIKNGNYEITMMSEYNNIEYFVELDPIGFGGDINLWAVAKDGNVYMIDMVRAGT